MLAVMEKELNEEEKTELTEKRLAGMTEKV